MPKIQFDFGGQQYTTQVADSFLQQPEDKQRAILKRELVNQHSDRITRSDPEKGVMDYIGMLERPAHALWTGFKESEVGGNVHRTLGGVDLTPEEGFLTGAKRGWMGEEEIRTQDYLPDDMDPVLKGVLGFVGDVAKDPLTYFAVPIVKGVATGISRATPRSVATKLKSFKDSAFEKELPLGEGYSMQDLARWFNAPVGEGAKVKGVYGTAQKHLRTMQKEQAEELPKLRDFFARRGEELGIPASHVHTAFRDSMERVADSVVSDENIKILGDSGVKMLDRWEDRRKIWHEKEEAFGLPYEPVEKIGYYPRVLTPEGRELVEKGMDEFIEGVDDFGQPIYRAGFRQQRKIEHDKTVSQINAEREGALRAMGGSRPNPVDRPYEFFHTDPTIALGVRWGKHNSALQRKWAIDELTDASRTVGTQFEPWMFDEAFIKSFPGGPGWRAGWREETPWDFTEAGARSPGGGVGKWYWEEGRESAWAKWMREQALVKPEMSIGRWVRRDPDGGYQMRHLNEDRLRDPLNRDIDKFLWTKVDDLELEELSKVKGLPDHFPSDEILDDEWTKAWLGQLELLGAGRFSRAHLSDDEVTALFKKYPQAKKVADNARDAYKRDHTQVFLAPKQVRRQIEDTLEIMSNSAVGQEKLKKFLKFYDATQNAWKSWTLGVRPAYHTRNALGNILNAYTITGLGENIPKAIRTFNDAAKLQYYSRFQGSDALRDQTLANFKGARLKIEESLPRLNDRLWNEEYFDTGYTMKEIVDNAISRGINAGHYRDDIVRDAVRLAEIQAGRIGPLEKWLGQDNPLVKLGFKFGGTIEGNARYAVFLDTLAKIKKNPGQWKWTAPDGTKVSLKDFPRHADDARVTGGEVKYWSTKATRDREGKIAQVQRPMTRDEAIFDIAGNQVKASQFDYLDVSKFERNVLKRVMPFYTWTRKNIPAQLKHLVLNPQRAEKLAIAKAQFEHETGDLDYSDFGSFWGDRVPVFLGKESKGIVSAFTMLNVVPMADLERMFRPKQLLTEMVSPLIKEPLEQLNNYDTFRKSPITETPGEMKDYLGVALPSWAWKLAQIIVPLTEINRLNPGGVFGERTVDPVTGQTQVTEAFGGLGARRESNPVDAPEIARWLRFFSGATVYDVNLRKQRYFHNKNIQRDLAKLKGKLKWHAAHKRTRRMEAIMEVIEEYERQKLSDPGG